MESVSGHERMRTGSTPGQIMLGRNARSSAKGSPLMRNNLEDLNNHLFAQMERLSDESLQGEALNQELQRTKAITDVASQIISNGKLALDVQKTLGGGDVKTVPKYLEAK